VRAKQQEAKAMGGLERGLVVEKIAARDLANGTVVYALRVSCEDDSACEDTVVVSKEMFDRACIQGLGHDTVIEYGTVCRIVSGGTEQSKDST
jgi:hypothetical protein